jgi:hypothetical protein
LTLTVKVVLLIFNKNTQITNSWFTVRRMTLNLRPAAVNITGFRPLLKARERKNYAFGLKPLIGPRFIHLVGELVRGTIALRKFGNC